MTQNGYHAEALPRLTRVVGIGGGGVSAVNRMIADDVPGAQFVAVDTTTAALMQSRTKTRVRLGDDLIHGMGVGGNPALARRAAEASADELHEVLHLSDLVFVVCGLGGGTGTGAAPVVARVAREGGAVAIGLVTRPYSFEGAHRQAAADAGIAALQSAANALIVVPCDGLANTMPHAAPPHAFALADETLSQAVRAVTELLNVPSLINIDLRDLEQILSGGVAHLGFGQASGKGKARRAAEAAVTSPLLERPLAQARKVFFNVTGSGDLSLFEVNEAAALIQSSVHPDADLIFGAQIDDALGETIRITLLASGFV